MGMDVYGKAPTSQRGEYFRANVFGWSPLANYCTEEAPPQLTAGCTYWFSNDCDGLDAAGSAALAKWLLDEIESGRTAEYIGRHNARLDDLPDEDCIHCDATGTRHDGLKLGRPTADFPCNGCEGKGKRRPMDTYRYLDLDDVREWQGFLEDCGGFEIC